MAPAERDRGAAAELTEELWQYRTVQTISEWNLLATPARSLADAYTSYKKESEVAGVLLSGWEGLAAACCRSLLLPVARTPLVRTPLRAADVVTSAGARLVERAMPQIKDKEQPLQLDMTLLLRVMLLPMSLSVALAHNVLEAAAAALVSAFPQLQQSAADFGERTLVGQWLSLWVMVALVLPVQFLSHPVLMALDFARDLYKSAVVDSWTWVLSCISATLSSARDRLASLATVAANILTLRRHSLGQIVALVHKYATRALKLVESYINGLTSTCRGCIIYVLSMGLAIAETIYYIVFEVTGLRAWVQKLYQRAQHHSTSAGQALSTAARATPLAGLVRRMRKLSAAGVWRSSCSSSGAAPAAADSQPRRDSGRGRQLSGCPAPPQPREQQDVWSARQLSRALLLTLALVAFALLLLGTRSL